MDTNESSGKSPGLSAIAKAAGVSVSTVSLALRNSPRISQQTKAKVQRTARKLGYQSDPTLGKLMLHLRNRRKIPYRGVICGLYYPPFPTYYSQGIVSAATKQATQLGYDLTIERIRDTPKEAQLHQQQLLARGVEGILFLPSLYPICPPHTYNWSRFSLVCAGHNPYLPDVDRVMCNWYHAIRECIATLANRGFERIGFVLGANFDFLSRRIHTAVIAEALSSHHAPHLSTWYYLPDVSELAAGCLISSFTSLYEKSKQAELPGKALQSLPQGLEAWFKKEKPQVLIIDREETAEVVLKHLTEKTGRRIETVVISRAPDSPFAGICGQAETVGRVAVQLLNEKILEGNKGVPKLPFEQLFRGHWMEGPSLRTKAP